MKKFLFFCFFILIYMSGTAQSLVSGASRETEYGDSRHRATITVESAELCPGQEVELGIYVDLMLGQAGGGSGTYTEQQLPPDPLENFMFYLYISDTSLAEVVCSSVEDRGNGYKVGYPVLSEQMSELSGGNLTCGYIVGSHEGNLGKRGRFTCIWVRNRPSTVLIPDHHAPLFKIRVRSKAAGRVTISIDDPNEIAFSTGLAQLGGYYYSFVNIPDMIPNRVPGVLVPAPGPDKALVSAGHDSLICINSRITFNAEGGKSYRWSQVYNPGIVGGYQNEYLSNRNTKNPTFLPERSGVYMYQVEAFNEKGCSTRDTVIYSVAQNTLGGKVSIDPEGTMIDSGSRVKFNLNGSTGYSNYKMRVRLEPDSLFASGANVLYGDGASVSGSITTRPVYEPTLVTATFEDDACQEQLPAVIRINGVDVSGRIAPFPVYRCGNDRKIKSLQLNLLTRGGSDQFLYSWHATDLEFTDFPLAAPKIDKPNARAPKLTYYGRCAISVDIYDMVSGKTVTISDTMIYRDWLQASTAVSIDTAAFVTGGIGLEGPYCEGMEHTYRANSVYAGKDARYVWQVNGIWKDEGVNKDVFTAALHRGDSVSCVLYSTEACVANVAVESKPFALDIRYPASPSIELETVGKASCDDIEIQATCRSVGSRFRMQWFRNSVLEKDTVIETDDYEHCVVKESFQSRGYYEGFTCRVVESDMPCGFDTVYAVGKTDEEMQYGKPGPSNAVYPFVCTSREPEAVGVQMPQVAVCNTEAFTLTAQVENLPSDFRLEWYKRSGGRDIPLGYYEYPYDPYYDPDYYLAQADDYGYGDCDTREKMLPVVQDGFKIILNNPDAYVRDREVFAPGDSVFFVLTTQTGGGCLCGIGKEIHSPYFVPRLLEPSVPGELSIEYVEKTKLCPGDDRIYHLVASLPGEEYYRLDWTFEGLSVTDNSEENDNPAQYFKLLGARGDTLQSRLVVRPREVAGMHVGTWGACTATVTKGCNAGRIYTAEYNLDNYVFDAPFFRIRHNSDTIVCANEPVEHRVQIEEVNQNTSAKNPDNEKEYQVNWATSLQDLLDGNYAASGRTFTHTPVPNGNQPAGTGDYDDNQGIFGYYIQATESTSGCEVIDSIFVMVGHPYAVNATLDFLYPGAWCDSSDYISPDYTRKVEGFPYMPGAQYAMLRIGNGGPAPVIEWGLNDEVYKDMPYDTLDLSGALDGDTLKAWVTTSMYTCLPEKVAVEPVVIRSAVWGDLYSQAPENAQIGEQILLQSYVGNHKIPSIGLGGYTYNYSLLQPDGTWQALGTGNSGGREDWLDSLWVSMPGYSGRFRVESRDKYGVCPVRQDYMNVSLAVNTEITMKAFDPATGREIKGLCPQSYAFVYADGQPAPAGNPTVWVNDTREPMNVLIQTYPLNPGANAYVGYWKNGSMRAVGPVGSSGRLDFDPQSETSDCRILEHGDTITAHIMPGDWFGAFYVHDTVSIDGQSTSYSNRMTLDADTVARLVITASPTAVCPLQTVNLSVDFINTDITWLPAGAYQTTDGVRATAVPANSTVYTAVGIGSNGCALRDSVLVNKVSSGSRIPLAIRADSLRFCGSTAWMRVEMDTKVSHAGDFVRFDWYAVEEDGVRLMESTTEPSLLCQVSDGMRLMAMAEPALTCQDGLSQSDTLQFAGFGYPVLKRLQPLSADTVVCVQDDVTVAYTVSPDNALMQWYGVMENYREFLEDVTDRFDYVADEDVRFEVSARNPDMPACLVVDTVDVRVIGLSAEPPGVSLVVDRGAVCGATEVTYTATPLYCDRLVWFVNGKHENVSDSTLVRIPRITGLEGDADSVFVWGIRDEKGCVQADSAKSAPVLVWRVEKPGLHLLSADTTVYENNPVVLRATASAFDGPAPEITWHDAEGDMLASGGQFELGNENKGDYLYYAMAFQSDLEEALPECYSYDSVRIKVEEFVDVEENGDATVLVSPNPTSGRFTLYTSVPGRVEIFSLTGSRVWFAEQMEGEKEIEIRPAGIYFIKVSTCGGTVIRKLVVR